MRLREDLLSELSTSLTHNLLIIQVLIAVLPLLGLLGTVSGMISVFDVFNVLLAQVTQRGVAAGISQTLLPTTVGLVSSLIGLFFGSDLNHRATSMVDQSRDLLTYS